MADEDLIFDANSADRCKQGKQTKDSPIHSPSYFTTTSNLVLFIFYIMVLVLMNSIFFIEVLKLHRAEAHLIRCNQLSKTTITSE